jgi:hypothetical protein
MLGLYRYDVGNLVRLERGGRICIVVWRGQVKVRNEHGTVLRENVYLLDNGFWDCYWESELHGAGRDWQVG